jgi:hypothetical protein
MPLTHDYCFVKNNNRIPQGPIELNQKTASRKGQGSYYNYTIIQIIAELYYNYTIMLGGAKSELYYNHTCASPPPHGPPGPVANQNAAFSL